MDNQSQQRHTVHASMSLSAHSFALSATVIGANVKQTPLN